MRLLKKSIAFVLSVLMLASLFTVAVSAASDEETYVIAGVEDLCGSSWEPGDLNNRMDAADGIYTKTYKDVPAKDGYEFKVTNGTWDKCWGVGQDNYKFNVTETCDVTITFDPATETISATGDYVEVPHGIEIDKVIVVGASRCDPAFLNGVDWQQNNDKNAMSTEDGKVYTITYKGVSQGEDYAFKFALNGSWDDNFGALKKDPDDSSLQWNGDPIYFDVEYNKADVTITFDFTNFNYDNGKSGAKYKLDVVETSEPTTPPYIDPTETPPYTDPETVAPTEPGSVEPSTFNEDTADEETTTAPEEQITPGFYVVGSEEVCGVEWNYETPWKYNEPMKLSADGETYYQVFENIKSSDGNVTDVGSDCYAFKVVYINENGNVTWHPGGFGNNTVVTVAEDDSTVLFQFKLLASRPTEDGTDPEAVLATVYGPEDEKPSDFSMVPYPGEPEETTAPVEEDTTVPETPVTPGFYVVGSEEVCGSEWAWDEPWKFNDPMRLSADGETYYQVFENIKSSDGNVTDDGPDCYAFKVVYINENGSATWHPGGMANNTVVTVAEDDSTVLFQFKLLASRPTKEGTDPEAVIATVYGPNDKKPDDFSKVKYPEPFRPSNDHRPLITDVVNSDGKVETDTFMFYVPESWRNQYNEYYNYNPKTKSFDGDGGYFAAGIYWWDGPYSCNEYLSGVDYGSWPGYAVTETVDGNPNIFKAKVPHASGAIIWNNLLDGGMDSSQPYYSMSISSQDITHEYYDPGEDRYGFYPNGIPEEEGFDGKIFVINPKDYDENVFTGRYTYRGEWFYYYGNGEYSYYKTREEAVANNALYKNGEFPEYGFQINKDSLTVKVGEISDPIIPSNSDARVYIEDKSIVEIDSIDVDGTVRLKGLKAGQTVVRFSLEDKQGYTTRECLVTVKDDRDDEGDKTVVGIKINDVELTEGLDAYKTEDYYTGKEYLYYRVHPSFVIQYSDGSEKEVFYDDEDDEYYSDGKYYDLSINTNQNYDNQWKAGTYKVKGELVDYDVTAEFTVTIKPSHIESVTFKPISRIEELDLRKDYYEYYDEDDDYHEITYYRYSYIPEYTVKLRDGRVLESDEDGEVYYNGRCYSLSYKDDQSWENTWGVGDHKVDAEIMGYKTSFNVTIKENPVEKITFNDISIIQGTNQDYYYDDNDNKVIYYEYDPSYTVTLKDGRVIKSDKYGDFELDEDHQYYTDNSDTQRKEPWDKLGTYKAKTTLCGKEYEFNVNIIESPVKEVKTKTLELIENADGYYKSNNSHSYFYYVLRAPEYSVVLNNGEVLYPDEDKHIVYEGSRYYAEIDEEHSNWKVGNTYKSKFKIMGKEVEFDVKIIPSPVKKVEFDPVELIEGADAAWEENGNYIYKLPAIKCKVTLNDGKVIEVDNGIYQEGIIGYVEYNGKNYYIESDAVDLQEPGAYWTVGNTYDVNVFVMGKSFTVPVKIVPSPVERIEVKDVQVKLNEDGKIRTRYDEDDNRTEWFNYNTETPKFKIILKDGTVINVKKLVTYYDSDGEDEKVGIEYNGRFYEVTYNDDQSFENQWGLGEHEAELNVLGFTQKYKVIVKEELDPVEPEPDEPGTEPVITPDNPGTKPTDPAESTDKTDNPTVKKKSANPIKVTAKTKTVKAKKLKKKAQKVKALTVKKAQGKVTYKLVKKGTAKKIYKKLSITKKGVIKIKKGKLKKGTYKIKIKITAKGNKLYNKKTITKTIKVKIK